MSYTIAGRDAPWEIVVGLEVHAQVTSRAKLFSGAATDFGAPPNSQVSFVDAGFPGMLPVINRECVAQAVRTGLGLNAQINLVSQFDRKNYFYADLPQGYQISQLYHPIVGAGVWRSRSRAQPARIGVTRLHLEQDAGKSLHDQDPARSFIDLNRSGVALMEIVSEPDIRTPEEAGAYLRKLRSILRYLGTCDGNMEEGSMRADVNVSVRHAGEPFRTRCEVKNVNSIRFVMQAVEAEAQRQVEVWESGGDRRAGNPAVRPAPAARPAPCAARKTRTTTAISRTPTCCRWCWMRPGWRPARRPAGTAGRQAGALHAAVRPCRRTIPACWWPSRPSPRSTKPSRTGRDAKAAANWVMGDLFAALNRTGRTIEDSPGLRRRPGRRCWT